VYNFTECIDAACWDRTIAPVAERYPVVSGEIGEDDCDQGFIDRYMGWADQHGISYLAWDWGAFDCRSGPSLISDYDGTPTKYGEGFRQHLLNQTP
jgi:endoglucanase